MVWRFRTVLRTTEIAALLRIIQALQKVNTKCVLVLTGSGDEWVHFVIRPDVLGSIATYASLKKTSWFDEYRIELEREVLALEINVGNLERSLKSASAGEKVLVRLRKRGISILSFEMDTALGTIVQEIPVKILNAVEAAQCRKPPVPSVRGIGLPPLNKLSAVVDRLKSLGSRLHLQMLIGNTARLSLEVVSEAVNVTVVFEALSPSPAMLNQTVEDVEGTFGTEVDVKNLSKALQVHQIMADRAYCFVQPQCLVIDVPAGDVDIVYYIPVHAM
mmetsp:Transcript_9878/g.30180  ORF Transcript_9878/g.30180 Transcript_9878/m.30180 type:complete len:275 (+) Transcript_9878:492-1316(+)